MPQTYEFDPNQTRLNMAEPGRDLTPTVPIEALHADEPHLLDYVKVVYKRRWLVGTVFLVIALAASVYTFTLTPIYEGQTELLIEVDNPNVVNFKEVIDEQQAKADYYQTQYKLLQSRSLAKKTLDSLKLWDNVELGGGPVKPHVSIGDRVAS